ncbi:MAG: NAD-dependent epimerase/dehydratase family protein [Gammaproteobacteria bacterium]
MKRNVLVLGGTGYFGRNLVSLLVNNGDNVCVVTRGNAPTNPACTFQKFDRNQNITFHTTQYWDVVYDQSCYRAESLINFQLLMKNCGVYILTSSQAVYPSELELPEDLNCNQFANKINPYGLEKLQAELFVKSHTNNFIIPRFPVIVGKNDSKKRLQHLIKKIYSGSIDISSKNPLLQMIDEYDAAKDLFNLPLKGFRGIINLAFEKSISAQELVAMIAKTLNVSTNISWTDNYQYEPFDLLKSESKTLCLDYQKKLGLQHQNLEDILHRFCLDFLSEIQYDYH